MYGIRRKTIGFATAAALAASIGPATASPLAAQDLDDVIARHYEAIGGEDAWRSMRSARRTGTLSLAGGAMAGDITAVSVRPGMFRADITVQGTQIVQAYDGETAWQVNPYAGATTPQEVDATTAESMAEQADFDGPLMGWREAGYSIAVAGTETIDGTEMIVLEVTFPNGNLSHYYLDASSYLVVRVVESRPMTGEMTRTLSDYREVGGMMFPFRVHSTSAAGDQEVTWDTYEVDVEIDTSIFSLPGG